MTNALPAVLQEIADVAGEAAALKIVAQVGGTRAGFPKSIRDDNWLVLCVGRDAAAKIIERFGGDTCDIPLLDNGCYSKLRRNVATQIHKLHLEGASSKRIAREVGVTQRTIFRHRRSHRGGNPDDSQGSLF